MRPWPSKRGGAVHDYQVEGWVSQDALVGNLVRWETPVREPDVGHQIGEGSVGIEALQLDAGGAGVQVSF